MHIAQKFEALLEMYRRPDGRRWSGQQIDEATDGVVTRSYVTNLRKGRIENPGYEKMMAIAKAMGFAPEAWFDEDAVGEPLGRSDDSRGVAGRIEHLFDAIRNPKTGEPYTNAEVARMTLGGLSEDDIEGIRTGEIPDPTVGQVVALAGIFGVEPSYLLDRGEPVFDKQLVEALRDETIREAAREISRLPERERRLCWGSCASSTVQKGPALPLTQGSRLIEKLLPAKRTPATHTSFECGISASSTVQSTNHRPVSFKILIAENGARRIELAGA